MAERKEVERVVTEYDEQDARLREIIHSSQLIIQSMLDDPPASPSGHESVSEYEEQDARLREIIHSHQRIIQSILDDPPQNEEERGGYGFDSGNDEYSLENESVGEGDDEQPYDDSSIEEGSSLSGEEYESGVPSPQRRRTHGEDEEALQRNLFLMMPRLHQDKIRIESLRVCSFERKCSMCGVTDPNRLWRCNECSMLRHTSPMMCGECMVTKHINTLHCMDVLSCEEEVWRSPLSDEFITFRLSIGTCRYCNTSDPLGALDTNFVRNNYIYVFVASQNGIFHCTSPAEGSQCRGCREELISGPIAFDCLPSGPILQSGCAWFTNSLISFIRTLRYEGGISANAMARSMMGHWLSRHSFLVNQRRNVTMSEMPNITVHWLEKKLAQILTTSILLLHPSWTDPGQTFALDDRLSSVCAACYKKCAQVHIDGFFKMRLMRRANSYRETKLRFFCKIRKDEVDRFRQIDLANREEDVDMCVDIAGHHTEFRAGRDSVPSRVGGYSQTGILTGVCPHRVPLAIIPMETKGEKFFMPHAMLDYMEGVDFPGEVDFYSYDVACRMKSYLRNRDPELYVKVEPKLVLGYFHSKSHKCKRYNVAYSKLGAGYNDGEQGERLNSLMLKVTAFLRYMREENMLEAMEDFLMCLTRQANSNIESVLRSKLKSCLVHLFDWHSTFVRLCMELEERLSSTQAFSLTNEELQHWVEADTSPPLPTDSMARVTGTKAEQEYVWSSYEWSKIGANHEEAAAALLQINQLGEPLERCLVSKKKYLLTVVKAYEKMTKNRVTVSIWEWHQSWCCREYIH